MPSISRETAIQVGKIVFGGVVTLAIGLLLNVTANYINPRFAPTLIRYGWTAVIVGFTGYLGFIVPALHDGWCRLWRTNWKALLILCGLLYLSLIFISATSVVTRLSAPPGIQTNQSGPPQPTTTVEMHPQLTELGLMIGIINDSAGTATGVKVDFTARFLTLPSKKDLVKPYSASIGPYVLSPQGTGDDRHFVRVDVPGFSNDRWKAILNTKETVWVEGNLSYNSGVSDGIKHPFCYAFIAYDIGTGPGNSSGRYFQSCEGFDAEIKNVNRVRAEVPQTQVSASPPANSQGKANAREIDAVLEKQFETCLQAATLGHTAIYDSDAQRRAAAALDYDKLYWGAIVIVADAEVQVAANHLDSCLRGNCRNSAQVLYELQVGCRKAAGQSPKAMPPAPPGPITVEFK